MIQDPEDEAFNEIEKQSKMRQEAVRSLNRKRQIENADRVHQGYEAMTQEKALQALHSENERLGLYKEAYAQRTEQEREACERCKQLEEQAYDLVGELRVANIKLSMRPQRTWVNLTAEQMLECNMDGDWTTDRETAKLNVQAKLKEKNT